MMNPNELCTLMHIRQEKKSYLCIVKRERSKPPPENGPLLKTAPT